MKLFDVQSYLNEVADKYNIIKNITVIVSLDILTI